MGCGSSRADTKLQTVDDSVHVMLAHDKKRQIQKGEQPHGYVPRAEHPLLKPQNIQASEEDDGDGTTQQTNGDENEKQEGIQGIPPQQEQQLLQQ